MPLMNILKMKNLGWSSCGGSRSDSGRPLFEDIQLALEPGQTMAIAGPSGAGKTTLLYLAAGFYRPTIGGVSFEGRDIHAMAETERARLRRRAMGLVFQNDLCLAAVEAWENAALPLLLEGVARREARRRAEAALERVGLEGLASAPTAALSGGQRQRLGLARATIGEPRLLLADEPTSDLDEVTANGIEKVLFDFLSERHCAALIVTHSVSLERRAGSLARLDGGRLTAC